MRAFFLALAAILLTLGRVDAQARRPEVPGAGRASAPVAYQVTGRVTDAQGHPVAGAEIAVGNPLVFDVYLTVQTDAEGRYALELPRLPATWQISAVAARVPLVAVDGRTFPGSQGAVRDFTVPAARTGPLPDAPGTSSDRRRRERRARD